MAGVWATISRFRDTLAASGELAANRATQARAWLWSEMAETLVDSLRDDPGMQRRVADIESAVAAGTASPRVAAHELVRIFLGDRGGPAAR